MMHKILGTDDKIVFYRARQFMLNFFSYNGCAFTIVNIVWLAKASPCSGFPSCSITFVCIRSYVAEIKSGLLLTSVDSEHTA